MGFFSCHMQKYQMSDVKGLEIETERTSENLKNKDIDYSKNFLNYDIVSPKKNLYQDIKFRIEDLKKAGSRVQKNSVTCAGFIFTLPEGISEDREKEYFTRCTDFLSDNFGGENIISAKVHKDESRPHLHVYLVPENKENGKLQARKSLDRNFLNKLHSELPNTLKKQGFDVDRGNSIDKTYIEDIHEFKKIKKEEERIQKEINKEIDKIKKLERGLEKIRRLGKSVNFDEFKKSLSKVPLTKNYIVHENMLDKLIKSSILTSKELEKHKKILEDNNLLIQDNMEMFDSVEPMRERIKSLERDLQNKDAYINDLKGSIRRLKQELMVLDLLPQEMVLNAKNKQEEINRSGRVRYNIDQEL